MTRLTLILSVFLNFTVQIIFGQTFQRISNESAENFAIRLKPANSEIAHKVIEFKIWDNAKNHILYFYGTKDTEYVSFNGTPPFDTLHGKRVTGILLVELKPDQYKMFIIDTFEFNFEIESVFFANADKDKDLELLILTKLTTDDYTSFICKCSGTWYQTYVYEKPDLYSDNIKLKYLREISVQLGDFDGQATHGYENSSKFKNAYDIKKELKNLGY